MKKVLLVDDDIFFRTMFSSMLAWNDYGFTLLQAGNGREAIELLHKNNDIALVFTDMNMPILDGVELIRYITDQGGGIPCIALSAYDDFSYVKPSLKNGADDYLLKHTLTKAQLAQILERYAAHTPGKGVPNRDNSELKARFLYDYITGIYRNVADVDSLFSAMSLPLLDKNLLLMVLTGETPDGSIPFSNVRKTAEYQRNTTCCMLQSLLDRMGIGVVFSGPDDGLIYLLLTAEGFENLQFVKQTAQMLTVQIQRTMLQYFNIHTNLLCAPLCRRGENLYESYRALMQEANREIREDDLQPQAAIRLPEASQLLDELYFGSADSLRTLVSRSYLAGRQQHVSQKHFTELTSCFLQLIEQAAKSIPSAPQSRLNFPEGKDDAQEAYVLQALLPLQSLAAEDAIRRYTPVVYWALERIHSGFQNPELSHATISEQLNVHPAYLSRLFKAQTGQNLSDYISEKRLNYACTLLGDNTYTVKDVAGLCGYDNYNYFFKVFKKRFGITPKEYRVQAISDRRR